MKFKPSTRRPVAKPLRDNVRIFTSIEFLQGGAKDYKSKPALANEVTAPDRKTVIFQMDLPLQALKPGMYLCQVNVIDDVVGSFSFPRFPNLIRKPTPPPTALLIDRNVLRDRGSNAANSAASTNSDLSP
jgi:hypothetical protein